MEEYCLTMTKEQAVVIQKALEEYFRIRMNQWGDLAEDLAGAGFTYDVNDPDNKKKFDHYLDRREKARAHLEMAMQIAQPARLPLPEECLIAEDVWQVIRHQLYLDRGGSQDDICVDARKPLQLSQQPLPNFEKKMK